MWTKLVHVYEARLRCKSHINAEKSRQLGEAFSADVFDMKEVPKLGTFIEKNGDQLEHHFYFGIRFDTYRKFTPSWDEL